MIDIIFLIIFFACLGGIIFIISRKLFFLSNIDISKIPKEKMAKMKRELLEKKIAREMTELKNKIFDRLRVFVSCFRSKLNKGLIFFKKSLKLIKEKYKLFR